MKKFLVGCFFTILITLFLSSGALAAIGPSSIVGQPYTNLFLIEENTPIALLSENITFDYQSPPDENNPHGIYLDGKVSATYKIANTSDVEQTVHMGIAFVNSAADMQRELSIQVDGAETDYIPYFGDGLTGYSYLMGKSIPEADYDYSAIAEMARNGGYQPKRSLREEGVLYTFYAESEIDEIDFSVTLNYDPDKTTVIVGSDFERCEYGPGGAQIMNITRTRIKDSHRRQGEIYVLGEQFDFQVDAYTNREKTEKTDAYKWRVEQKDMCLGIYLFGGENKYSYKKEKYEGNVYFDTYMMWNLDMMALQYDGYIPQHDIYHENNQELAAVITVTFPPNSKKEITVKHGTFTSMDRTHTADPLMPVFTEKFLFTSPNNWQSVGNINVTVHTHGGSPYIVSASPAFKDTRNHGYNIIFDTMPTEDLTYSMHAEPRVRTKAQNRFIGICVAAAFIVLCVWVYRERHT